MEGVNFLKEKKEKGGKRKESKEIKWVDSNALEENGKKEKKTSSLFSFLKNLNQKKVPKAGRSHEEILKLINDQKEVYSKTNFFKNLLNRIQSKNLHKNELQIDYSKIAKSAPSKPAKPREKEAHKKEEEMVEKKIKKELDWKGLLNAFIPKKTKNNKAEHPKKEIKQKEKEDKKPEVEFTLEAEPVHVLETNLVKKEVISFFEWEKNLAILIFLAGLSCVALGSAYWLLSMNEQRVLDDKGVVDVRYNRIIEKINKKKEFSQKITDFQDILKTSSSLLDKHVYWTNFFKFLEDSTLKDVYFFGFVGDTSGSYKLGASASNFNSIAEQIKLMRANKLVEDVKTEGGSLKVKDVGGEEKAAINFDITLKIKPEIFSK